MFRDPSGVVACRPAVPGPRCATPCAYVVPTPRVASHRTQNPCRRREKVLTLVSDERRIVDHGRPTAHQGRARHGPHWSKEIAPLGHVLAAMVRRSRDESSAVSRSNTTIPSSSSISKNVGAISQHSPDPQHRPRSTPTFRVMTQPHFSAIYPSGPATSQVTIWAPSLPPSLPTIRCLMSANTPTCIVHTTSCT
jgi:hypothetical protein